MYYDNGSRGHIFLLPFTKVRNVYVIPDFLIIVKQIYSRITLIKML